jgi:hypothetical protein
VAVDLPDHESTTNNSVQIDVVLGESYQINFGDLEQDNTIFLPSIMRKHSSP